MLTESAARRLGLAAATYAAGLLICGVVILLGKKSHSVQDLLIDAWAFPTGLAHATNFRFSPGPLAPIDVIYIVYGALFVALISIKNKKIFWALYAVFATLIVVNTGGCVALNEQIGL